MKRAIIILTVEQVKHRLDIILSRAGGSRSAAYSPRRTEESTGLVVGDCFRNREVRIERRGGVPSAEGSPRRGYHRESSRCRIDLRGPRSNIPFPGLKMRIKNESKDWRDVIVLSRFSISLAPRIENPNYPQAPPPLPRRRETPDTSLISNLLKMFNFFPPARDPKRESRSSRAQVGPGSVINPTLRLRKAILFNIHS